MYRIELPIIDGFLLLTLPFGTLSRWLQVTALVSIIGLLGYLVFRLYRLEASYVPRPWARCLLVLRMAMIAFVLGIIGLQPILRHVVKQTIPSHVLIAIDRSDSMNITDPQRNPLEKLELARSLKLASDLASTEQLDGWIEQLKQLSPPRDPAYALVIERIDSLPRRTFARAALTPEGLDLIREIGQKHKLQIAGFHQIYSPLPESVDSLRAALITETKNTREMFTDLKLPLQRGLEMRDEYKNGLVGIIVLSDGQHNWGAGPGEIAAKLGRAETEKPGVPVYTIVCGARMPPPDLAIASLKASPPIVFKHGTVTLDLRLQANNIPEGKIKITVDYPEAPELPDRKQIVETIDYDGVNQPAPRSIPVKLDRAAIERLTVTIEAITKNGGKAEDRFPENNSRQVIVNVAPDKAKVLVVDGEARWEMHYLQTALLRDETMETKSVVFEQPRVNLVTENARKEMKLPDMKLPGPDDLPRMDCIILGDVAVEHLTNDERLRLEKYVADRGGTLVILAGKRSMPFEYLKAGDPITRLLPITLPKVIESKDGFPIKLTGEGMQAGFLRLDADPGTSQEIWNKMPPHYWGVTGKAKRGTVVLAQATADGRKLGPEQERDQAMIARHYYGFGRVVYVGIDSTWRWRFKTGDKYHHQFWSQVIRWAASDRALIAGNDHVRFGVREPVYRSNQEIEMIVRLGETVRKLDANAAKGARLIRKTAAGTEESVALARLQPNPEIPGQLEGTQANLPPGDYAMELAIPDLDRKLLDTDGKPLRATFKVLPPENGEKQNLATNWERMKEIADKSGGLMLPVEKASEIIEKLKSRTAVREIPIDQSLWQSWWLLAPLLMLLTAEWLIRKKVGLA